MKVLLKITVLFVAITLSVLSVILLVNYFPEKVSVTDQLPSSIEVAWTRVGFFCALTAFVWVGLFTSVRKALPVAIGAWILIGGFYTALEVSMHSLAITPIDYLHSSDEWMPTHVDGFMDGGSTALGLVNGNGEVIYLWASPMLGLAPEADQSIFLVLNYTDPNGIRILPGSDLEGELLSILDNLMIRPSQEEFIPDIKDFQDVLLDRSMRIDWLQSEKDRYKESQLNERPENNLKPIHPNPLKQNHNPVKQTPSEEQP